MADGIFEKLRATLGHFRGDVDMQNLVVRGRATLRGAVQLVSGVSVKGGLTTDTLSASGAATLSGGLGVTGSETVDNLTVTGTANGLLRASEMPGFSSSGSVLVKHGTFVGGSDGFGDLHINYGTSFPNNSGAPVACMGDLTILNCIILVHGFTNSGFIARIVNGSNGNSYVNSGLVRINWIVVGN